MSRYNKLPIGLSLATALVIAACGGASNELSAELQTPAKRQAAITIAPALDVSNIFDPALAKRIIVDSVTLNVAEVRLLGADPRIPAGGHPLLSESRVVETTLEEDSALELAFPEQFLEDDDLSVFLRIDRSDLLEQASVVVRARFFSEDVTGVMASLVADDKGGSTDPDGDPSKCGGSTGSTDPDGDPSRCGSTDPDGDPSDCPRGPDGMCTSKSGLTAAAHKSVAFELRDDHAANLVASLARHAAFDVVIGIPASRWITPEAVSALEQALAEPVSKSESASPGDKPADQHDDVIVLRSRSETQQRGTESKRGDRIGPQDDYFLSNGEVDRGRVQR